MYCPVPEDAAPPREASSTSAAADPAEGPVVDAGWFEHLTALRVLVETVKDLRARRLGARLLSDTCQTLQRRKARAAAEIPVRGPERDALVELLVHSEAEGWFVLASIFLHRKVYPRTYLRPFVRGIARRGTRGGRLLKQLVAAWGSKRVCEALLHAARAGDIPSPRTLDYLLYHARGSDPLLAELVAEIRAEVNRHADRRMGVGMRSFTVVDLVSQRDAFREHVRGWNTSCVMELLQHQGTITQAEFGDRRCLVFRTPFGPEAVFLFDQDEIVFVGDHHTST